MDYKILIVEDEPLLSAALRTKVETLRPEWNVEEELRTVADTVDWIKSNPGPALIFMDIQLADGVCFSIFEQVDVTNKGIIFTTAYDEYAIEAFDVNSIAYLLKPIKTDALKQVFQKVDKVIEIMNQQFNLAPSIDYSKLAEEVSNLQNKYRKRMMVSRGDGYKQVPVDEIAFFSVDEKLTQATTFKQKEYIVDVTLGDLEKELNPEVFFRVNRQFIINIDAIEKVEHYFGSKLFIKLLPNLNPARKVIVSRDKASQVKQWLNQ
ncbi:LytR/AlgR family response regulator transcription factor [Marinilabilia rubra]|uniref:DNA-binding response regulator n=1 Tax=Marinilabilia rubra TaxID=2162893 RepID=A0A2U2B4J9_9BACT|nr:LytTR family DNA-binding domain-containing protein [Marinilabilia rubra]PWD97967.1 DNA-binding response regulator [Marinilabilia rubra]